MNTLNKNMKRNVGIIRHASMLIGMVAIVFQFFCAPIPPVDPIGSSKHHTQVAKHYFLSKKMPRAERAFREALQLNPKNEEAVEYLALILYHTHRYMQAEQMAQRTISLNPGSGRAYLVIAGCMHQQGNQQDALGAVRKALSLLRRIDDRKEAEELIEQIQDVLDTAAPKVDRFAKAEKYFKREEWAQAETLLAEIIAVTPQDSAALELYALLQMRSRRFDAATVSANKLLHTYRTSAIAHFVLGMCRKQKNDMINADPLLRKARSLATPYTLAMFEKFAEIPPAVLDTVVIPVVKIKTAIFPLWRDPSDTSLIGIPLFEMLTDELRLFERFECMPHTHVMQILQKQKSEPEVACDVACAVKAGKVLNSSAVLIGSISRSEEVIEIDIRLIKVATAQVLGAVNGRCMGINGLKKRIKTMVVDLAERVQ